MSVVLVIRGVCVVCFCVSGQSVGVFELRKLVLLFSFFFVLVVLVTCGVCVVACVACCFVFQVVLR